MTARAALAAVVAVVALVLAGCGGDEAPDAAGAQETWDSFLEAMGDDDGAAACATFSSRLADPANFNRDLGLPAPEGGASCEEAMDATLGGPEFSLPLDEELEPVEIDAEADPPTAAAGGGAPVFVAEDGEWKLDSLFVPAPQPG